MKQHIYFDKNLINETTNMMTVSWKNEVCQ